MKHILRDLMRAFKMEVSIVLAHDPTLAAEIKYDLALFEKADAERRQRRKPSTVSILAASIDGEAPRAPQSATRRASTGSNIAMSSQAIRYDRKHYDSEDSSLIHHSNIRRRSVDSAIRSVKTPLAIAKAPGQTPSVVKTVKEGSKNHHGAGLTPAQSLCAVMGRSPSSSPPTTSQRVTICSPSASDISVPKWNVSVEVRSKDAEKENFTSPLCVTTLEKRGSVQEVGTAKIQDVKRPRKSRRLVNKAAA